MDIETMTAAELREYDEARADENEAKAAAYNDMRAALGELLEQVYQMQGMFDDDDGAIAAAIDDAEKALEA